MRRVLLSLCFLVSISTISAADGVFVRFKLDEPAGVTWFGRPNVVIHNDPWQIAVPVIPAGADADPTKRLASGEFTEWFDLKTHGGAKFHARANRVGGVAEFPCLMAVFDTGTNIPPRRVTAELATAPDEKQIVRRFTEVYDGKRFGFLVSPNLQADGNELETVSEMAKRHREWARAATNGKRVSPKNLLLTTSFWGDVPAEDVEAVWLLGFNHVGVSDPELQKKFPFRSPAGHHWVDFGPELTRGEADKQIKPHAEKTIAADGLNVFGFSDEVAARTIGTNATGIAHFHQWLAEQKIEPRDLGVSQLTEVVPIENPDVLRERQKQDAKAANRIFYYTSRFRQVSATERIKWLTESMHRHAPAAATNAVTSTMVADHPYFSGTGLGMGMDQKNMAWGGWPLALDWFDLARNHAVDLIGIEDWMGLQYMYGPRYTWEGFQLMGFQTSMMRSGSDATLPIIAWVTPSNDTNFVLKASSALAQGAKHLFFWTYGPTCFGTENYWADLRGAYDGFARYARQLAQAEHIIAPGKLRKTRVALLYSLSSDLWQPFGYIHMLERRATYLALVHSQYMVDMLTEEDVIAGRLKNYDVLYTTDPCIATKAVSGIETWVKDGGRLYGSCAAGSRNEFNEPTPGLAAVFGIEPEIETTVQDGEYRVRGNLNGLPEIDRITHGDSSKPGAAMGVFSEGVIGLKVAFAPSSSQIIHEFSDRKGAGVVNKFGNGTAIYYGFCPGLSYLKEAHFVPSELREKYPERLFKLFWFLGEREATRLVELSVPVVEAGIYDAPKGSALVLANFTYEPIAELTVRMPVVKKPRKVRSLENGKLKFKLENASPELKKQGYSRVAVFTMKLGLNDIVLVE